MLLLKALQELASQPGSKAAPFLAGEVSCRMTQNVLLPCLVWRAGSVAAVVRGCCMMLLTTILQQQWLEGSALQELVQVWL